MTVKEIERMYKKLGLEREGEKPRDEATEEISLSWIGWGLRR